MPHQQRYCATTLGGQEILNYIDSTRHWESIVAGTPPGANPISFTGLPESLDLTTADMKRPHVAQRDVSRLRASRQNKAI